MLTANLLMYRLRGGKFQIRFIDPDDPDLLVLAQQLIDVFGAAAERGICRDELEEELSLYRRGADIKLSGGLIKLLFDRSEFQQSAEIDYPALRRKVFAGSGELLVQYGMDIERYQQEICRLSGGAADLYGDLPGFERISSFPAITPAELLNRYNLSLAQGMLFFARKLTVKVSDPDAGQLRRMLKYLKFFRLLAEVKKIKDSHAELEISGPCSLFGATRKYALNLAVFFPAVVKLASWHAAAELEINGKKGRLVLDDSLKLVSHYRNFSAYVPEEVRMFHRLFAERSESWKIIGDTPVLHAGKQELIVPDISFQNEDGKIIHLELFHAWHSVQLEQRLDTLCRLDLPLIAGIDRKIMDNDRFDKIITENPRLKKRIFRFSDFPGVETTLRMLNNC